MSFKKFLSILMAICLISCLAVSAVAYAETLPVPEGADTPVSTPNSSSWASSITTSTTDSSGKVVVTDPTTGKPYPSPSPTETSTATTTTAVATNSAPVVVKNPTGETVDSGGRAVFTSYANGNYTMKWYISKGDVVYACDEINTYFAGVTATGTNTTRLIISNITDELSGWSVSAEYTNAYGITWSTEAAITVNGVEPTDEATATDEAAASATPAATVTPAPNATATPIPATTGGTAVQNGVTSTGGSSSPSISGLGSGTNTYNSTNTAIGTSTTATEPASDASVKSTASTTAVGTGASSGGTASNSHVGAYILAVLAGIVIIGSVAVMILYMKGKISLGGLEKLLGGTPNQNDASGEFYNPDDFKDDDTKDT